MVLFLFSKWKIEIKKLSKYYFHLERIAAYNTIHWWIEHKTRIVRNLIKFNDKALVIGRDGNNYTCEFGQLEALCDGFPMRRGSEQCLSSTLAVCVRNREDISATWCILNEMMLDVPSPAGDLCQDRHCWQDGLCSIYL